MQAPVPCAGCTRLGPMCSEAHRHRDRQPEPTGMVRPGRGRHCRARQGTPLRRMALGQRAPCWAQSCFLRRLILARTRACLSLGSLRFQPAPLSGSCPLANTLCEGVGRVLCPWGVRSACAERSKAGGSENPGTRSVSCAGVYSPHQVAGYSCVLF